MKIWLSNQLQPRPDPQSEIETYHFVVLILQRHPVNRGYLATTMLGAALSIGGRRKRGNLPEDDLASFRARLAKDRRYTLQ